MRLVKYPLLLEQLAKQTAPNEDESEDESGVIKKCVDRSREILESIDKQVAEAQNEQKLSEIQRNLDTSGLEKMPDSSICSEYRVSKQTAAGFAFSFHLPLALLVPHLISLGVDTHTDFVLLPNLPLKSSSERGRGGNNMTVKASNRKCGALALVLPDLSRTYFNNRYGHYFRIKVILPSPLHLCGSNKYIYDNCGLPLVPDRLSPFCVT